MNKLKMITAVILCLTMLAACGKNAPAKTSSYTYSAASDKYLIFTLPEGTDPEAVTITAVGGDFSKDAAYVEELGCCSVVLQETGLYQIYVSRDGGGAVLCQLVQVDEEHSIYEIPFASLDGFATRDAIGELLE